MELDAIRQEIDQIDEQLIALFKQRMDCAKRVGEYKKERGMTVLNTERENEVLDNMERSGGEYGYAARLLFSNIMELSRALQHDIMGSGKEMRTLLETAEYAPETDSHDIRIACQGIKGANAHEAALRLFPNAPALFCKSWNDVFRAVRDGKADYGVLPVENSSAGSVSDVYDLILKYRFLLRARSTCQLSMCSVRCRKASCRISSRFGPTRRGLPNVRNT